jgi:phosphoenolpyruvate---glycerone phosphotransferase subunit DhaL
MTGNILNDCVRVAHAAILEHRDEIAGLDQAIGDGDHVFNIIRGLEALEAMRDDLAQKPIADALKASARKLLETIGGSSGPLFATLLLGMSKACESESPTSSELAKMFNEGVTAMSARGKATVGEKTMLDVLIPVANAFVQHTGDGVSGTTLLEALKLEAQQGMESTREMIATKGRASFLGERAIGHIDPGARSSQVIIAAICDHLATGALQAADD